VIPILISLVATVVAAALTWRFCMRPMLRIRTAPGDAACCVKPATDVQGDIQAARAELTSLQDTIGYISPEPKDR
jgi:peptidoglycan/LPS O-acetylase OafA/YrhL